MPHSVHRNLGVHISFVRSSLLDSWTWDQLRTMKVGGNAALHEFFNKSLMGSNKDAKTKYTSKIAVAYKEKLEQRKTEDMASNPGRLIPETKDALKPATATTSAVIDADDFFNTWNEPKKPTSGTSTPTSSSTPPPVLGMGGSTSTTSSPQRVGLVRPQRSTLTPKKTTLGASKPMKLGVKKVAGANFEEAEARAKAEAERIAALGAEAAEQERLEKKAAAERAAQRTAEMENARNQPKSAPSLVNYYQANTAGDSPAKANNEGLARLGMGMGRMGFGAAPSSRPSNSYSSQQAESTSAREKFGNQKAISSDQYFGRNNYDSKAQAEASSRLQAFTGATAISSNQYFGREDAAPQEEEVDQLSADFAALGNAVLKGADLLNDMINDMSSHYNY
ncbi:ADP-ribosylation factor GTPase activating protein, ER-Golgi transport [Haplosporangium sp. Z 767]|nr:ADP-ribosylation factor GTPase activating protein, ER-Golgi transport [Haplosporangium sp. Z 767]KAF9196640.1 ADP-ribosylation factor GTPase activating protein, ER-Golgi transport [Haplosporangium sp. Z 11]